ncbi:arylsulfatase [Pseudoprevotella muciniphila]|uniref:Arylsulfatase n=1 Tax=Pseudoprevotella muciniphila TaxID=2133944 RepID=A0A5P8E585_9BACT|nr:arylsulfatase [Pseudoprevotella muciniphila]QFQ12163.1 arylsulfatase [Pseudoprevotella muciniphila]
MKLSKLALLGTGALAATAYAQEKPNILYIMCDDLGYADIGCYGQQYIATPNLDRLASQGMRFTQAYCGSPVSAPSRASFMTGQHTGHTHVRGNKEYWSANNMVNIGSCRDYARVGQEPYDTAHVIIPEIMKDNGYATGMFGKWAGGYEGSISTPKTRGIDEYYGYICQFQAHLYYPNFLNRYSKKAGDTDVRRIELTQNTQHAMYGADYLNRTQYSSDLIHQEALKWLDDRKAGEPFIGIFTYTLPHAELLQPEDSILLAYKGHFCQEKSFGGDQGSRYNPTDIAHAQFAAMVTRLDAQVGQIMDKLDEKGLADNTLVIFTSDNGPHAEGGADQSFFNTEQLLQGLKRNTHEGGIRIPFIARWPGKIKPGTVSDLMFAFYDLMPTFCDVAGIKNYEEKYRNPRLENDYFDGISIYPTLTGEGEQVMHDHLYWEFHETNMIGVRKGNWKLVVKNGNCQLFDLATDLHEDHDLSASYPEVVKELKNIIKQEHTESNLFKVTLPN